MSTGVQAGRASHPIFVEAGYSLFAYYVRRRGGACFDAEGKSQCRFEMFDWAKKVVLTSFEPCFFSPLYIVDFMFI